jgi:hypothetical protein
LIVSEVFGTSQRASWRRRTLRRSVQVDDPVSPETFSLLQWGGAKEDAVLEANGSHSWRWRLPLRIHRAGEPLRARPAERGRQVRDGVPTSPPRRRLTPTSPAAPPDRTAALLHSGMGSGERVVRCHLPSACTPVSMPLCNGREPSSAQQAQAASDSLKVMGGPTDVDLDRLV